MNLDLDDDDDDDDDGMWIRYGLPRDAVYAGLPLIDTRKTIIDRFCPAYLKRPTCNVKRYREYNGMCNNLDNPQWGATLTSFRRLLPPAFADGISAPRAAASGAELPSPRFISAYNHRDLGFHDHAVTVFLPTWGQFIDHDMTLGGESKGKPNNNNNNNNNIKSENLPSVRGRRKSEIPSSVIKLLTKKTDQSP